MYMTWPNVEMQQVKGKTCSNLDDLQRDKLGVNYVEMQ